MLQLLTSPVCSMEEDTPGAASFAFPPQNGGAQPEAFKGMLGQTIPPEMMQQFLAAAHDPQKFQEFVGALVLGLQTTQTLKHSLICAPLPGVAEHIWLS